MKFQVFFLISMLFAFAAGCSDTSDYSGKYQASNPDEEDTFVVLELKPGGKGVWTFDDEDAFFKWESRGKRIWLHTKTGGVITGNIEGKNIRIELPGVGIFLFRRI